MGDGFDLPSWGDVQEGLEWLEEQAQGVYEDFSNGVQELEEDLEAGWDYWRGRYNEAVASYNEHDAVLQELINKKNALDAFMSYLNEYDDEFANLFWDFSRMDSSTFMLTQGAWRDGMHSILNEGFGPDHLYNLALAHRDSHESLIALVQSDIDSISSEISEERTSLSWLGSVVDDVVEDARNAGFPI